MPRPRKRKSWERTYCLARSSHSSSWVSRCSNFPGMRVSSCTAAFVDEFAGLSGVPTGAAGGDVDFFQRPELGFRDLHLVEKNVAGVLRDAAQRCVAHSTGLLVDFLEHEVLEPALFRHDRVPGHMLHLADDGLTVEVHQLHAIRSDDREVAISQEEEIASVVEDGGDVGSNKIFVFAQADYCGRAIAGGNNLIRLFHRDHRNREDAGQFLHRFAYRFFQRGTMAVARLEKIFLYQVGYDFGVGLSLELVAFLDEPLL